MPADPGRSPTHETADETADETARRRERRAAVRAHHPDAGGDPGALQSALLAIDRRYGAGPTDPVRPASDLGTPDDDSSPTLGQRVGARVRAVRERIPPGWPGHRRLIDLGGRPPPDDGRSPSPPSGRSE